MPGNSKWCIVGYFCSRCSILIVWKVGKFIDSAWSMQILPQQKQWASGTPAYTTKQHSLTDNTFRIIFVLFGKTRKNIHRVIPKKLFHVHRTMLIAFVVRVTSAPHLLALEVFLCVVPRHLGGGVFCCLPQVTGREDWKVLLTLMMSVWFLKFESRREQAVYTMSSRGFLLPDTIGVNLQATSITH